MGAVRITCLRGTDTKSSVCATRVCAGRNRNHRGFVATRQSRRRAEQSRAEVDFHGSRVLPLAEPALTLGSLRPVGARLAHQPQPSLLGQPRLHHPAFRIHHSPRPHFCLSEWASLPVDSSPCAPPNSSQRCARVKRARRISCAVPIASSRRCAARRYGRAVHDRRRAGRNECSAECRAGYL